MNRSILRWELIGIAVISILGSVLHFTFYPPQLPIFRDSLTGAYGILG